ncbi:hypothetical protein SPI_07952 [Niveomyces insectorum RCEF 264]|uniref:Uncharacterized protein n=1 Tax=Niveomyces insectorum RCEF 264 TaxID=1081102 RepID=A0A167P6G6_9HYPO|nr:hypothetical protein SPI_07952 [Niveomyces insectorum RCEF 264]
MTSIPFAPYWMQVGPSQDPFSWVFFAVARVAGHHRPVAVVSSLGDNLATESLQGGPLVAACQRVAAIFAHPANAPAVRAEITLADEFYARSDVQVQQRPEPVELPEFDRRAHDPARRHRMRWDSHNSAAVLPPFPFTASCLLQGVGFDARAGVTRAARPESLSTVYRDKSLEWGMVVFDITEPASVRYGIVGFPVAAARFVDSPAAERYTMGAMGPGAAMSGELHVMDEVRPRQAMSAADYMARFEHDVPADPDTLEELSQVPLVDADAMALVWPPTPGPDDAGVFPSLASLSIDSDEPLDDKAADAQLVPSIFDLHDFDVSVLDEARAVQGFPKRLQRTLIQYATRLGNTPSSGKLIRLAFADRNHVSLERLSPLSIGAVSAVLGVAGMEPIRSVSLCIDRIAGTPAELVAALAACDTLRALYLLVSPDRENDGTSVQIFEELAARPTVLRRTRVVLAGAHAAALRKRFWLPTVPRAPLGAAQVAPLDVYPVQQMLVQQQHGTGRAFDRSLVYLGDALLKPERLATGFLLYLHSLLPSDGTAGDDEGRKGLFSFSSCSASLVADAAAAAPEISPIPAESFAVPFRSSSAPGGVLWPRMRDLVSGGWSILVSLEVHWDRRSPSHCIRYAFIRPRHGRITVDPPTSPPEADELEAVDLLRFLALTAPEVDSAAVESCLYGLTEELTSETIEGVLPRGAEPLSVLSQPEAAAILQGFLDESRLVNRRLRLAMEEDPNGRNWYPELLGDHAIMSNPILQQTKPRLDYHHQLEAHGLSLLERVKRRLGQRSYARLPEHIGPAGRVKYPAAPDDEIPIWYQARFDNNTRSPLYRLTAELQLVVRILENADEATLRLARCSCSLLLRAVGSEDAKRYHCRFPNVATLHAGTIQVWPPHLKKAGQSGGWQKAFSENLRRDTSQYCDRCRDVRATGLADLVRQRQRNSAENLWCAVCRQQHGRFAFTAAERYNHHSIRTCNNTKPKQIKICEHKMLDLQKPYMQGKIEISAHRQCCHNSSHIRSASEHIRHRRWTAQIDNFVAGRKNCSIPCVRLYEGGSTWIFCSNPIFDLHPTIPTTRQQLRQHLAQLSDSSAAACGLCPHVRFNDGQLMIPFESSFCACFDGISDGGLSSDGKENIDMDRITDYQSFQVSSGNASTRYHHHSPWRHKCCRCFAFHDKVAAAKTATDNHSYGRQFMPHGTDDNADSRGSCSERDNSHFYECNYLMLQQNPDSWGIPDDEELRHVAWCDEPRCKTRYKYTALTRLMGYMKKRSRCFIRSLSLLLSLCFY